MWKLLTEKCGCKPHIECFAPYSANPLGLTQPAPRGLHTQPSEQLLAQDSKIPTDVQY